MENSADDGGRNSSGSIFGAFANAYELRVKPAMKHASETVSESYQQRVKPSLDRAHEKMKPTLDSARAGMAMRLEKAKSAADAGIERAKPVAKQAADRVQEGYSTHIKPAAQRAGSTMSGGLQAARKKVATLTNKGSGNAGGDECSGGGTADDGGAAAGGT